MRAMGYAICLTAVILAVGACTSQPPEFSAEDESRVRAMFDSTVANIRAGDWTTWSRQFAEDAVLYPLIVFRRSAGGSWEIPAGAFNSNLAVPAPPATSASPRR